MAASKQVKDAGFKSLIELSSIVNVSTYTLNNWFNNNKTLFDAVVLGGLIIRSNKDD